jgi:hypothetical protein
MKMGRQAKKRGLAETPQHATRGFTNQRLEKGRTRACGKGADSNLRSGYYFGSGGWIRTIDLRVMSPTSYRTAPPRVKCTILYMNSLSVKIPHARGICAVG